METVVQMLASFPEQPTLACLIHSVLKLCNYLPYFVLTDCRNRIFTANKTDESSVGNESTNFVQVEDRRG